MALLVVLLVSANGSAIQDSLSSLHFGPVSSAPTTWRAVGGTVSNLAGPVDVDLTQLPASGPHSAELRIRDTFGPIQLTVPPTAGATYRVHVQARTAFGPVNMPGVAETGGTFSTKTGDYGLVNDPTAPVVDVVINDVFGPVSVVRSGAGTQSGSVSVAPSSTVPPEPTVPPAPAAPSGP
jgi:hypothetical protein